MLTLSRGCPIFFVGLVFSLVFLSGTPTTVAFSTGQISCGGGTGIETGAFSSVIDEAHCCTASKCFGSSSKGQTTLPSTVPSAGYGVVSVGEQSSCGIRDTGTSYVTECWGTDRYPNTCVGLCDIVAIAAIASHTATARARSNLLLHHDTPGRLRILLPRIRRRAYVRYCKGNKDSQVLGKERKERNQPA